MNQLPAGTEMLMEGLAEPIDAGVEETTMERGVSKMTITNSQVVAKLKANLYFRDSLAADEFIDWYLGTLRRIGWFQVRNPRNGRLLTVRFEHGAIGELTTIDDSAYDSGRAVVMEYLR